MVAGAGGVAVAGGRWWGALVLAVVATLWGGAGCTTNETFAQPPSSVDTYSNIYATDYVGAAACADCHAKQYRQWSGNLHRAMNRRAGEPGAVVGAFDNRTIDYAGGKASFITRPDGLIMSFHRIGQPAQRYRVTRTIGSRYIQEYVGVPVRASAAATTSKGVEVRLPFGYLIRRKKWLHQQYFDSWFGPEYDERGQLTIDPYKLDKSPWNQRCIWCHNTYPFELRAIRGGASEPIGNGRERFVSLATVRRTPAFVSRTRKSNALPIGELISVGISCESCHLGGREHAKNDQDISFVPRSADLRPEPSAPNLRGGRKNHIVINSVCAQCHSTPASEFPNKGVIRNSSEALDMFAGSCTTKIKCTHCHDPHQKGPGADAPDQPRHIAACVKCHGTLAAASAQQEHSRHPPGTVSCLDCHMPKMVQGVSSFVRSHRISSPTNDAMLRAGAPNACSMCHLDRSIKWTVSALNKGWAANITLTRHWLTSYGGDLTRPVGEVWMTGRKRLYRAVAAAAYARTRLSGTVLRLMLQRLDDPVAYYRMWMLYAVEKTLGRALTVAEYGPTLPAAVRGRQVRALLARERGGTL